MKSQSMKTRQILPWVLAVSAGLALPTSLRAADGDAGGIKFKFPVGLTFALGTYDVDDKLKESFQNNGYEVTSDFVWPVGLTLSPRVEFPMGLGVGLTLGPTEFLTVERHGEGWRDDDLSYIIPVGGYVQYSFLRDKNVSPYLRAGARYPITGGEYFSSSTVGPFGAVGVEFLRNKKIAFGVEAGYDWCKVKVSAGAIGGARSVEPVGFNVSIFALF